MVVVDVTEQEVAALLPPQRSLSWALRPAEAVGEVLDWLRGRNDLLELRRELLDARRQVIVGHGEPSHRLCRLRTLRLRKDRPILVRLGHVFSKILLEQGRSRRRRLAKNIELAVADQPVLRVR